MLFNVLFHIFLILLYIYCLARVIQFAVWFAGRMIVDLKIRNIFIKFCMRVVNICGLLFAAPTLFAVVTGLFALFSLIGIK